MAPASEASWGGLPSEGVTALAWDGETVWVGTVAGLGRWRDGQLSTVEFPLAERHILALHADAGALWVGTARGIARFEAGTWQTWQRGDGGLPVAWATSFATHEGRVVVGTFGAGVWGWTGAAWEPIGSGAPAQVTALASDGATLWAGAPRGVGHWGDGRWTRRWLPAAGNVYALLATEAGLWAGTDDGLLFGVRLGSWLTTPVTTRVTALVKTPNGVLAATDGAIVRVEDGAAAGESQAPVSSLLHADGHLVVGTLGRGLLVDGAAPVAPSPPPVVLLHGLGDSDKISQSNLRFLAGWLQRDGHAVALAPFDPDAPLLDNVAQLRRAVQAMREQSGQPQVVLVAHSFGGLVARGYLASGATDVAGLATLGTPHAGTRFAYDFVVSDLAATPTPSQREMLPEHAALLAPFEEPGTVPQLHVGGDPLPDENLFAGFPPHDGIIEAASATAAPGATRRAPLLHGWTLTTLQYNIPSFLWPDNFYVNILRPWMQGVAAGTPWTDRAEPLPLPTPGFAQRPLFANTLAAGQSVTLPVTLSGQPATWFLDGSGVALSLVAPDGTLHPADRFGLGETVAHLPYRDNGLEPLDLWSTQGQPGPWQATLRNETDAPAAARLALVEPGGARLDVTVETAWADGGTAVPVTARAEPGQTLFAALAGQQLPMIELAPGEYRAVLTAPRAPGYHPLRVAGGGLERWAVVGTRSAAWTVEGATVERDGAGARLRLDVSGEGRLALGLRLRQGETILATRLVGPFRFATPGAHTLAFTLPLPADGPLTLDWQLFDARGALVPATDLASLPLP